MSICECCHKPIPLEDICRYQDEIVGMGGEANEETPEVCGACADLWAADCKREEEFFAARRAEGRTVEEANFLTFETFYDVD